MKRPVIFTDIDGVYNTPKLRELFPLAINEDGLQAVREVAHETLAHVVISSSWRIDHPVNAIALGLPLHKDWRTIARPDKNRGLEVAEWLSRHPEVGRYAIIDDWSDFLPEQLPRLVQTDSAEGISPFDIWKLKDILTGGVCKSCDVSETSRAVIASTPSLHAG